MPFSPEEIEHKTFLAAMRGYDRDEVDAFLRAVAADLRAAVAIRDARAAREPGAALTSDDPYTNAGLAVAEVLHSAVEVADGLRRQAADAVNAQLDIAESQVVAIKERAHRGAERIVANAQRVLDDAQERAASIVEQAKADAEYILASSRERLATV